MIDDRPGLSPDEQRRLIIDAAENGMLLLDERGTIEHANGAAERLLGYTPGALHGRPVATLACAEITAALKAMDDPTGYTDPIARSAANSALAARRADGSTVHVHISAQRLTTPGGSLTLIALSTADVMPSLNRAGVEVSGVQPAAAMGDAGAAHGGRWRLDVVTGKLTWSNEIFRIYGLAPTGEVSLETTYDAYDPADRERVRMLVGRACTEGIPYRDEAHIIRPDGSIRAVVHGGAPERDANGTIVALAGFLQDVTAHEGALGARQRLREYLQLANRAGKVGIWELDLITNRSVWDRNMFPLYGLEDQTIEPTFDVWISLLHPHDRERAVRQVKADIAAGAPSDTEFRIVWPNGDIHYIRSLVTIVYDASGKPTRLIGTDWDVTEVRLLGEQLREEKEALVNSEARYRALTEALPQMVWVIDAALQFEYVNWRWIDYTGLSLDESRAAGFRRVIYPADAAALDVERAAESRQNDEWEIRMRRADGAYRWHLVRSVPFHDATGEVGKWIMTATDIEERKAAEKTLAATVAELEHIAHHDPMTDLPNRMLLMERLTQAMSQANRSGGAVIVMYVDLDRFKAINDTFGHAAGDTVLKQTGARIAKTLRAGDTASRVGGDEFIVVCATSAPASDVTPIARRLLAAVTAPITIAGEQLVVEASIGISMYPTDGNDADTLIRKADAAMYLAKRNGRNTCRLFGSEELASVVAATQFEAELRHAIAANQLVVHYQPIIDLRLGLPRAAEALVRWQHPERGLVPPGEFIAFAEERGLIGQIGGVVLERACETLAWLERTGHPDIKIGINVSAHQFGATGFVDSIVAALRRHQIEPCRLTIEITESVVMGNTRSTLATLDELDALGVSLSIDDFGTGYSSLAYIKRFPIATLKIDRSFVRDISDDKTDQAIAKTIITLAHSLGMRVVAEGVETHAQLAILAELDVDSVQGYLFSRPLGLLDFQRYIETFTAAGLGVLSPALRHAAHGAA